MIDYEMTEAIAKKIKEIRLKQGVTLSDENGRTIPSLPVFMNLAKALNTSPKDFFEGSSLSGGKHFLLLKKNEYLNAKKENRFGFDYHFIFSQMLPPSRMQTYLLTLKPKAERKTTITDGYEFKFLLHGHCEYHIGDEVVALEEGDSLYFDASLPHMPVNKSKGNVVMLVFYFIKTEGKN